MSTPFQKRRELRLKGPVSPTIPFNFRENLPFKLLSLLLAGVLYFYVQSERNPTISRTLGAQVVRENQPGDVAVETDQQRVMVTITGPRSLVERIKEEDIRAVGDLKGLRASEPTTTLVRLNYLIQGQPPNALLALDPPNPPLKLRLYPPKTKNVEVTPQFPQEPVAGQVYGSAEVFPKLIAVSGRADKVNRVARLIAYAVPAETGGRIDGDFPVTAYDSEGNPVDEVKLERNNVHVTVPLQPKPPVKIVLVSPEIVDIPLPPYKIESITVTPHQLKVTGRHERLNQIATITTEEISVRDFTAPEELTVRLNLPSDVMVRDMQDRTVTQARIRIRVHRVAPANPITPPVSKPNPVTDELRDNKPPNTP